MCDTTKKKIVWFYQFINNMLTEKDYCDYETCVALKELGYKTPTSAYFMPNDETLYFVSNPYRGGYVIDCFRSHNSLREDVMTHDFIDAPTMWEAQKWLREEKNIDISVTISPFEYFATIRKFVFWQGEYSWEKTIHPNGGKTYEEALLEGIKESIKYLNGEN